MTNNKKQPSNLCIIYNKAENKYWRHRGGGLTPNKRHAWRYVKEQALSIVLDHANLEAIEV